jgi:hypothetical protein
LTISPSPEREAICQQIKAAFAKAQIGAIVSNDPHWPHARVTAYINSRSGWHTRGQGWQRQAIIFVVDAASAINVYMSGLYKLPEGKKGRDIQIENVPLLFNVAWEQENHADTIVDRVCQASLSNKDTIQVQEIPPPPLPVPLSSLTTLVDLIDVHERYYLNMTYHYWLKKILLRLGRVHYKGEEWAVEFNGLLSNTQTAPGSTRPFGPDGEPPVHTNAAYVRLDPFRDLI